MGPRAYQAAGTGTIVVLVWLTFAELSQRSLWLLDNANLIFHEAGHALLMWAPHVLYVLGGTLGQLAVPLVCLAAFWRERAFISSMLMVWWTGQNLVNVSIYISDARAQVLPLVGPASGHDWAYLLGHFHLLSQDTAIGKTVLAIGACVMFAAIAEIALHVWYTGTHRFHR